MVVQAHPEAGANKRARIKHAYIPGTLLRHVCAYKKNEHSQPPAPSPPPSLHHTPVIRRPTSSYLAGKVVWVTGASSGLGEQLAIAAAAGGARGVIISGRREDALERVRQACEDARPSGWAEGTGAVRVLPFDVGDLGFVEKEATSRAVGEFGTVDALVLNAGVRFFYFLCQFLLCSPLSRLSFVMSAAAAAAAAIAAAAAAAATAAPCRSPVGSFGVACCPSCHVAQSV